MQDVVSDGTTIVGDLKRSKGQVSHEASTVTVLTSLGTNLEKARSSLRDWSWALACSGEARDFLSTGSTPCKRSDAGRGSAPDLGEFGGEDDILHC